MQILAGKQTKLIKRSSVILVVLIIVMLAFSCFSINVFAEDGEIETPENATYTVAAVNYVCRFMLTIAIPIAAIGFVSLAISMFTSNEKRAEESRERAKYLFIALICLLLLTSIIFLGRSLVGTNTWKSDFSGGLEIIEPADADGNLVDITDNG